MSVYKVVFFVIPAKAGIQNLLLLLDSHFRGNDVKAIYKQTLNNYAFIKTQVLFRINDEQDLKEIS